MSEVVTWDFPPGAVAECQRISDRLRGAQDSQQVRAIADEERENVQTLAKGAKSKPLAINISDLKKYMQKNVKE